MESRGHLLTHKPVHVYGKATLNNRTAVRVVLRELSATAALVERTNRTPCCQEASHSNTPVHSTDWH
jgi:hypothetical protein